MKSARFVGLFAILTSMLVLAQSGRAPLVNQPNGLSIAQQPYPRVSPTFPQMPQAAPFAGRGTKAVKVNLSRPGSPQTSGLNFANGVAYGSGGDGAWSVAVADLNGDGKPDIVVGNFGSNNVGVLLGNGDGTFQTVVAYDAGGAGAYSVAVADLNGDGKPDIVLEGGNNVGVLLGNGDGTFQTVVTYGAGGAGAVSVAVADLNGDSKPDIVVANSGSNNVGVLLGNGDGTFQTAVTYGSGGYDSWGSGQVVAAADVNGDGKPDIVVANNCADSACDNGGSVGVLLGNGDGTFQTAVAFGSGGNGTDAVAVADVNGDGKPDLVVTNLNSPAVGVLLGNGDGTFQQATTYYLGYATHGLAVEDVDGDGKLDIVVAESSWSGLSVLLGNGDGTFQTALSYTSGVPCDIGVAVTDVSRDGKPDILVTNPCYPSSVGVLINTSLTPTTTALTSSLNPSNFGQAVTFTATVTAQRGFYKGTPTGTASFYDGTTLLGTGTLSGGVATYTTSALSVGSHSMKAVYAGDTNCLGSTSGVLKQVVNQNSTTTSLTSSLDPSIYGQAVTFTATVTGQNGTPTGTVSFYDGTTFLGTGTLSNGVATYGTSALSVGSHSMTAVYGGDTNFSGSTSNVLKQVVNQASTTTALRSSRNPSNYGQAVTFHATITGQYGGTPTGTVSFYDGTTLLGTGTLKNGAATYTISALSAGSHSMTAVYGGDQNFVGSTSGVLKQVVKKAATTTTLSSSKNPSKYRQTVTFTATVTGQYGGTPGGTVTFKSGKIMLAKVSLTNGVAQYSTKKLTKGKHTIAAIYSGNVDYKGSSASLVQTVD